MGCKVYANGNEIACKAGAGKVIAAFPDVCLTPPPPPTGPIPVPYADTSFSRDMRKGSKTVKIKGKEVMLKDKSFYKTSPLGDEAATRSQGANVITHVITGKTYFIAWSADVKFEGQNVDRHADLTTSNHASPMAGTPAPTGNQAEESKKPNDFFTADNDPCDPPDSHVWDCKAYPGGRRKCPDCWVPPCVDNAKEENDAYEAEQKKPLAEQIQNQKPKLEKEAEAHLAKAERHRNTAAGWAEGRKELDDLANSHEKAALGQLEEIRALEQYESELTHVGFITHCTKCHREQEIDVITKDFIGEVKYTADSHKAAQMARINSVREQCFADRTEIAAIVPAKEGAAMEDKIEKWKTDKKESTRKVAKQMTVRGLFSR